MANIFKSFWKKYYQSNLIMFLLLSEIRHGFSTNGLKAIPVKMCVTTSLAIFGSWWIGQSRAVTWPACSPDLSSTDFYFMGHLNLRGFNWFWWGPNCRTFSHCCNSLWNTRYLKEYANHLLGTTRPVLILMVTQLRKLL